MIVQCSRTIFNLCPCALEGAWKVCGQVLHKNQCYKKTKENKRIITNTNDNLEFYLSLNWVD